MTEYADPFETPRGLWCVVWTESRAEKKVAERIATMGLSSWLPTVTERRRWSDRWKDVICPLFPGYLFARASSESYRLLQTPGVLSIVKSGGSPALLTDDFVNGLRDALSRDGSSPERLSADEFQPGTEVVVQEGALKGVRGVVRERRSRRQLVIWVGEVGRGVAFTIGSALVKGVA